MLQARITLGLQATLILFLLGVLHMTGSVLGGLGIVSDLFVVVGAAQVVRFFINEDLRFDVSEFLSELLNLNDISGFIVDSIDEVVEEVVEEGDFEYDDEFEEVRGEKVENIFKSMFLVGPDLEDVSDDSIVQTEEEEIFEGRKV